MITVVAAIIRRNRKILITRRPPDVPLPNLWEFPGGKVEASESLQSALQREIREELNVDVLVGEEFFRTEHHYTNKSVRLHFFNCVIIEGEPRPVAVTDLRWVDPCDLQQFEFPEADRQLLENLCR
jgi:mutator protein MutT